MRRGYCRTSTREQNHDLQINALHKAGCEALYVDQCSGSTTTRPELDRLLQELVSGDTLVVWRLDRLGRSLSHLIQVTQDLAERGVGFQSLTESIDTTTAGGRLVFHVFGALAEFERQLIQDRTRAGLEAARSRGVTLGQPRKLCGERLSLARSLLEQGETKNAVARKLGVSRETLRRALNRASSSKTAA